MPIRLMNILLLLVALTLFGSISAAHADTPSAGSFSTGRGAVDVSGSGSTATATANTNASEQGWAAPTSDEPPAEQTQGGDSDFPVNGAGSQSGFEAAMQPDSDVVKLCRTFNAGHAGIGDERVKLCYAAPTADEQAEDSGQSSAPSTLAARAVAQLTVPEPVINLSPQPSDNKWDVLAVGLPIWFWSEDPGPITTSATADGIEIVMTATRGQVRFDWGDDTTSVCSTMRQRTPNTHPLTASPDCGHTYMQAGDYTITATAGWAVTWHALGQTGTIPLTTITTTDIPIREFAAVVVG